ncbi:MAG: MMPL family transporter, partial [Myxococcales bacterium]|nr:MMPL family transporter [Myxococcales bacterium]
MLRADPFGFSMPLLARSGRGSLAGALPEGARMLGSGAIASPGSELVVLVARPRHPARDVRSSADLLGAIRTETERLAEEYDLSGRVEVGFAGPHALAAEDADAIRRDLSRTTLIAAVAILVVFLWGFRGWRSLLAAALPLLVAVALTAGTAALVWGSLSTVAAAAAALLLGLGVDFAIVVLASEPEGQEESDPLWTALEQAGPGVVIGGLTTIATFGAFGAAHFRGLRELGWVVAVGVAWSLISVLLLLPALAGRPVPRRGSLRLGRWLIDTGLWRPRTMFGLWGAVVVVGVVLAPRVAFEGSLSGLRSSTTAAVRWQQRLSSLAGWDSTSMTLGIEASDGIEVQQAVHQAANVLAPLLGEELVAVSSPLVWLPGASEQRAGLAAFAGSGPNPSLRRDGEAALV